MESRCLAFLVFWYSLQTVSFDINPIPRILVSDVKKECPVTRSLLDFCIAQHSACVIQRGSSCSAQFEDCARCWKEEGVPGEKQCSRYLKDACFNVVKLEIPKLNESELDLMFQLPELVSKSLGTVLSKCSPELKVPDSFNSTIRLIENLTTALSISAYRSDSCSAAITLFERDIVAADQQVSSSLSVPSDRFYCGFSFGSIGKFYFRQVMSNSCAQYSVSLNHCCAKLSNCYLKQMGEEFCNVEYLECNQGVLRSVSSRKQECTVFVERSAEAVEIWGGEAYRRAGNTNVRSAIQKFDGNFHKPIDASQTMQYGMPTIIVFTITSSPDMNPEVRKTYNEEVLKHGWNERIVVDSCTLMLEDCRRHHQTTSCLRKWSACLADIDGKPELLGKVLRKIGEMLTAVDGDEDLEKRIEQIVAKAEWKTFWWTVAVEIAILVAARLIERWWDRRRHYRNNVPDGSNSTRSAPGSSIELIALRNPGLADRRGSDGDRQVLNETT